MTKRLFFLIATTLFVAAAPSRAAAQSEDAQTRPSRQEIVDQILKAGKMPAAEREARIDQILANPAGSQTPRSDFVFCLGPAYLDSYRGQRCLAHAFESGRGVVEDLSEAYVWYSVALDNSGADAASRARIEAERDRIKARLLSTYPAPTDEDLDDLVKAQKSRILQYQTDAKKTKN